MITKRIIPCLDVRNGRVVKGTNFEGIRDVADPVEMARMYNAAGADELVFYDITASFEGRALFTDILTSVASETASAVVRSSCEMLPAGTSRNTSPYMASTVPLHSSSLQTMRRTAGRMRSNFGFASG